MSVAFRRESDEEHKEPRFELPLPAGPNLVTRRGLALIRARIGELEAELTAAPGNLRREELDRDLRYWRTRQATAQIAPAPAGDIVAIGTRVTIEQAGRTRTLEIVGHDEADPANARIAFAAPLAQALIGAEVGDEIEFGSGLLTVATIEIRSALNADL